MPQTQIACPRCRQMIAANVEQLFDVTQDPQAKQRLLGGVSNFLYNFIRVLVFQTNSRS